ncbi:Reticulon-domain-containing protein [Cokeromyces recurvatus]|uniref:Reticulon-domain-containing protein n=1 Tax=Cokeromyces recurvatus TaxID=90255 RepID=UPI002220A8F8|nr:Reticulon-domain-containing protein [Cokeromyces recurvatus]KAI7906724.1 Reticulon-domain-containing protein [Cokeromyces recurvatus]
MHHQNQGEIPYQEAPLKNILHQKENDFNPPASTAPSASVATAPTAIPNTTNANPFLPDYNTTQNPVVTDTSFQTAQQKPQYNAFPFEHPKSEFSNNLKKSPDSPVAERDLTRNFQGSGSSQRNETTYRIENEVLSILQWKNPIRSGSILALIVGSILLTRWYSLLQIGSSLLTLAIGINLIYVNVMLQSRKILANQEASHPYSDVIKHDGYTMLDKQSVGRYATILSDVAETIVRALTRIIFIENTSTSMKWMAIFFVIWKVSAHVSTMNIILGVVISAFTFPRLYISNKDVVDAQLHKGQALLQTGIKQAQDAATQAVHDTYAKSRAFVAKTGTTGTDAKNTMTNQSVTLKEE